MYINFRSQNFFELYRYMYCYYNVLPEAIFVVYIVFMGPIYLQRISVFMQNFKFGGVTVLAVQIFNKIKQKKMMKKNLKKHVSLYFTDVMSKILFFSVNLFFFVCFRH